MDYGTTGGTRSEEGSYTITLINGNIQTAQNLAVPNGSMSLQLNVDATVIDAPFGFVSAEFPVVFNFDATGNIIEPAQIYSNLELNPQNQSGLGTYYLVTFYDANNARINKNPMWWQFIQVANSTVDIGEMTPFATVGGNVIFYPTSIFITTPTPTKLGGVFSQAGAAHNWIASINLDGSTTLSQPSFADISGQLTQAQLPTGLTFGATTFSGLITAQAGVEIGIVGTTSGVLTLDGSTSGQASITAPAIAGTASNPISFSNGINIPAGAAFAINRDTGLSRTGAAALAIGNGTAGNATGSLACANLQLGVAGSLSGVITMEGSASGTAAITAPATAGTITNPILFSNSVEIPSATVYQISTDTGLSRTAAGVIAVGNATAGNAGGTIQAATFQHGTAGPTWASGGAPPSGAPAGGNGSLFTNTVGTHASVTLFYVWDAATTMWIGIA